MAQVFQTYEDYLKTLTSPTVETGAGGATTTQPKAVAGVSTQQDVQPIGSQDTATTTASTASPTTTKEYTAPESGKVNLDTYNPTQIQSTFSSLFNPVQKNLKAGYGTMSDALSTFNQNIGQSRNWAGIGGENILDTALGKNASDTQKEAAKSLFWNDYTAPTINQDVWVKAAQAYQNANPTGKALTSASTLQALMTGNEGYKGLTRGEVRKEAGDVWQNPEFAGTAGAVQKELRDYYENMSRIQGESEALGSKRTEEEKAIQKAASEGLTSRYGAKETELGGKVSAEQAKADALQAAFGTFQEKGGIASLKDVPNLGFDPYEFKTPAVTAYQKGKDIREQVMAKYPGLTEIPVMERGTNSKGKETWKFPDDWYKANKDKYTKSEMANLKKQARLRQIDLVEAGFSPYVEQVPEATYVKGGKVVTPYFEPGRYGQYLPLYGSEEWTPTDIRDYVYTTDAGELSPMTVASDEDIDYLNAIRAIREEAQLDNPLDYVAPTVQAQVDRYKAAQEADLSQRYEQIADVYTQLYGPYPGWTEGSTPYGNPGPADILKPGHDTVTINPEVLDYLLRYEGVL